MKAKSRRKAGARIIGSFRALHPAFPRGHSKSGESLVESGKMIENFLALLQERPLFAPVGLGALLIALFWLFGRPNQTSGFRVREADLRKGTRSSASGLAEARFPAREPLALPGISITGAPHEILGIAEDASAREIQAAYLERVKRYHPDKVGAPGTRQWNDAQKIAVALNRARDEMLAREKRRSSDSRKA